MSDWLPKGGWTFTPEDVARRITRDQDGFVAPLDILGAADPLFGTSYARGPTRFVLQMGNRLLSASGQGNVNSIDDGGSVKVGFLAVATRMDDGNFILQPVLPPAEDCNVTLSERVFGNGHLDEKLKRITTDAFNEVLKTLFFKIVN